MITSLVGWYKETVLSVNYLVEWLIAKSIIYKIMKDLNSLTIRPAKTEDAEALASLATQLGYPSTTDQTLERFRVLQARPNEDTVIVAEMNGQVVGWVHAHTYRLLMDAPEVEIGGLVVDESIRGQGIGERLMEAAEVWAHKLNCSSIYVRSNTNRTRAHEFYKALGYEIVKSQYALRKMLK